MRLDGWVLGAVLASTMSLSCGGTELPKQRTSVQRGLEVSPLSITEVAQSAPFAGSTADKVEVHCAEVEGCPAFRVCDSAPRGRSCSVLEAPLSFDERVVVSRGTSITVHDEVWLSDATFVELVGTRVGPFACEAGTSASRSDCADAAFAACDVPSLGQAAGACVVLAPSPPAPIEVRFTTNQHGAPASSCTRPVCQQLLAELAGARHSIDFAIYGLRNQQHVVDALIAAQARGVRVRGVVDAENADCTDFGYAGTADLIAALAPGSVVCDSGPGYSEIMHNKFFVFDRARVWTGSTNLSDTELGGEYHTDVAVLVRSTALAQAYQTELEEMFGGRCHRRKADDTVHVFPDAFGEGTSIESYFSPTDGAVARAVLPLIDGSLHTLDVAMFFFTSQQLADALLRAHARGVQVRVILDAGGAENAHSKHPALCRAGLPVKIENWGGKSHSKWAVADAGDPARAAVVLGSMNWTDAGDRDNDENTLYAKSPELARAFSEEFTRQWEDLRNVPVCTQVAAEGADSSRCDPVDDCTKACLSGSCCDALDNDYDGKVDADEERCACRDGVDNDSDGYVDADDFDCRDLAVY